MASLRVNAIQTTYISINFEKPACLAFFDPYEHVTTFIFLRFIGTLPYFNGFIFNGGAQLGRQ